MNKPNKYRRPRYDENADVALTYGDFADTWYVVTGPLHPYGVDSVGYPTYGAALAAYRLTCQEMQAKRDFLAYSEANS